MVLAVLSSTLIAVGSPVITAYAEATNRSLRALTPTPWIGPSIDSGKLRYGIAEGRVASGTKKGVGIANVEYMENKTTNIRHIFDYRVNAANINHNLRSTPAFNIIETKNEYNFYSKPLEGAGVASFTESKLVGTNEVMATGSKMTDKKMAISVSMKANDQQTAVSHIYTITNNDTTKRTIYPIKAVDTQLNMDDYVPIYSRGPGKGVYIESNENPADPTAKRYRLDYIMDIEDGTGPEFFKGAAQGAAFKTIFGEDVSHQSAAGMDAVEGEVVFGSSDQSEKMDTAIYMSWGEKMLEPGQSLELRYDVGIRPLVNLENTITTKNLTRADGKNYVGDEVEYTINMKSPVDRYYGIDVSEDLSWYLDDPTAPVTVINDQGVESTMAIGDVYTKNANPSDADPKVGTLKVPGLEIGRGKEVTIKVKAKITHKAVGMEFGGLATISGKSEEESLVNEDVETAEVIRVENAAPVFEGLKDSFVDKGEEYDLLAGVTASDMEDGDLTSEITVSGYVDIYGDGDYELIYTVTDSHGNTTEKTITVTVG